MAKLIELNEAAAMLGVTPEELNDMRSRSEIFGYRDGASWKFKQEEIERVREERGDSAGGDAAAVDEEAPLAVDDDLSDRTIDADASEFFADGDDDSDLHDSSESILVSEEELGGSERSTSSTIIGKTEESSSAGDSDLRLADEDQEIPTKAEKSDIQLGDDDDLLGDADAGEISDLKLSDDDEPAGGSAIGGGSGIGGGSEIGAGSDIGLTGADVDLDGSDLGLAGSNILGGGSDKASGSDLSLDDDDDEALELVADADDDLELGEDLSAGGSGISLDDDDDLVLDGGSDVTLSGDSGINLSLPIDSGISLEDDDALELSGSGISSLELPEDEDQVISLEEEEADPEAATQLKADNDFMLTPVEGDDDDPSDSGSQVIALDTEELDAEAATQLGMSGGQGMSLGDDDEQPFEAAAVGAGAPAAAYSGAGMVPAEPPEAPYSIFQVVSLFLIVLLLAFSGMLMVDVVRNIWSFDQPYEANTALMDMILDAVGKSK